MTSAPAARASASAFVRAPVTAWLRASVRIVLGFESWKEMSFTESAPAFTAASITEPTEDRSWIVVCTSLSVMPAAFRASSTACMSFAFWAKAAALSADSERTLRSSTTSSGWALTVAVELTVIVRAGLTLGVAPLCAIAVAANQITSPATTAAMTITPIRLVIGTPFHASVPREGTAVTVRRGGRRGMFQPPRRAGPHSVITEASIASIARRGRVSLAHEHPAQWYLKAYGRCLAWRNEAGRAWQSCRVPGTRALHRALAQAVRWDWIWLTAVSNARAMKLPSVLAHGLR